MKTIAAELLPRTPELARGMTDHLYASIPELATSEDEELRAELRHSAEANVAQVLRLMASGASVEDVVVPHEALEFLRGNVRRGIALHSLLRSYRLGHAWLWERWLQALPERIDDPAVLAAVQEQASWFMFAYVDRVCDVLAEEFASERERMMRGLSQLRTEVVRAILAGDPIDEEAASRRLGYDLRRQHVAFRVWTGEKEVRGLERAVGEAAAAVCPGEPLVVASGAARFDVWCASFDPVVTAGLGDYEPPPGVLVAFGRPAKGITGFRGSHAEALQAARIRSLMPDTARAVTAYADVELVSLLASDLPRARAFVAGQLGPLAADDDSAQKLRETVLAFLAAGGSATRVAKQLYVHQNTVAYRIKRAEELLGRRVADRPTDLTCALTLASVLGPAVLADKSR